MLKILITYLSKQRISTIFIGATLLLIFFGLATIFSKKLHESEEAKLNLIVESRYHTLNLVNSLKSISPNNFNREELVEKTDSVNFHLDELLRIDDEDAKTTKKIDVAETKQESVRNYLIVMKESLNNNLNQIIF